MTGDKNYQFFHKLLKLPRDNLEAKLLALEEKKRKRQELHDSFLSDLLTDRLAFKIVNRRQLDYTPQLLSQQLFLFTTQLHQAEERCWRDILELDERIDKVREELSLSQLKTKLIDDELP